MKRDPNLLVSLGKAFALSATAACLVVELWGKPTWPMRVGAVGFVALSLAMVAVWFWGFRHGRKAEGRDV
jgi:membrane protein implicated in regulation of membrane protease activity